MVILTAKAYSSVKYPLPDCKDQDPESAGALSLQPRVWISTSGPHTCVVCAYQECPLSQTLQRRVSLGSDPRGCSSLAPGHLPDSHKEGRYVFSINYMVFTSNSGTWSCSQLLETEVSGKDSFTEQG